MNGNVPELVILSYANYKKLESEKLTVGGDTENTSEIDHLNREILMLKEEIRQKEEAELGSGESVTTDPEEEKMVRG